MNLSKEVAQALNDAIAYARENNYEYITPEMLLLFMMDDETFSQWIEYHFAVCERQDLIGASHHTLDILRKR